MLALCEQLSVLNRARSSCGQRLGNARVFRPEEIRLDFVD